MKIGILGGTFDPIHQGHLYAAEKAKAKLGLSQVWLMPAAQSPFKTGKKTAAFSHRLAMARLAAQTVPGLSVCALEGLLGGTSYTVDTLRRLTLLHPQDTLYFIMGADVYADFSRWKEPEEIQRLVHLVVVTRPGYRLNRHADDERIHVLSLPGIELSSEQIRGRLKSRQDCSSFLPPEVETYIQAEKLYENRG